jgi:hypothetical protein
MPLPGSGLGYGPPNQEAIDDLSKRLKDRTPDELERMEMCKLHAAILEGTAKIEWHASEVARVTEDRIAAQEKLRMIMARLGIETK